MSYSKTHRSAPIPPSLPLTAKTQSPICYLHTSILKSYLGEQSAYIYTHLFSHTRLSFQRLQKDTHLRRKLLKQLLVGLIQLNCVVYKVESGKTYYEVNHEGCWKLVYADEVLSVVNELYGEVATNVIQNVILSGHLAVNDYINSVVGSEKDVKLAFVKLVDDGWLIPVKPIDFWPKSKIFDDCVKLAVDEYTRGGLSNSNVGDDGKPKAVSQMKRALMIKDLAREKYLAKMSDVESKEKLWKFDDNGLVKQVSKLVPLTLNFARVLKHIRTQQLVSTAIHRIGSVSARIYQFALKKVEAKSRNVRLFEDDADRLVSSVAVSMGNATSATAALSTGAVQAIASGSGGTTQGYDPTNAESLERMTELKDQERGLNFGVSEILRDLQNSKEGKKLIKDLFGTICDGSDAQSGDKRKGNSLSEPPSKKIKFEASTIDYDDNNDDDDDDKNYTNGASNSDSQIMTLLLQHLKILASDPLIPFVMETNPGSFYVPFTLLQSVLPTYNLKQIISSLFGSQTLRIINCIERKRLLDEKAISKEVLMKEFDVRRILTILVRFNVLEIQEIPRTNDRSAIRAAFAYRVSSGVGLLRGRNDSTLTKDKKQAYGRAIEMFGNCFMHNMGEVIDQLIKMKADNRILLDKVSREDVKGREAELLMDSELKQLKEVVESERLGLAKWNRMRNMGETLWFMRGV